MYFHVNIILDFPMTYRNSSSAVSIRMCRST